MDGKRRGEIHRHGSCYRCHRPMLCGDWAWLVDVPAVRIALDATVTRVSTSVLMCDECGMAV